jgi:hypothetical protein
VRQFRQGQGKKTEKNINRKTNLSVRCATWGSFGFFWNHYSICYHLARPKTQGGVRSVVPIGNFKRDKPLEKKTMRFSITALVAVVLLIAAAPSSSRPDHFLVRLPLKGRAQILALANRGFDIAGVDLESNEFVVLTDSAGLKQLQAIPDVKPVSSSYALQVLDTSYKRPEDVETLLRKFEAEYPHLASVHTIGKSTDGKDILAIRLTDTFLVPNRQKPAILFDAMHHAREVMTPEIALDIADYLTSRYATDDKVKEWLRLNEIWVVPMLNPDGNSQVWTRDTMWRKKHAGWVWRRQQPQLPLRVGFLQWLVRIS